MDKGSGAAREGEDDEDEEHTVVNELPNKVDEFLEYVNRIYFDGQLDLGTKSALKADLKQRKENSTRTHFRNVLDVMVLPATTFISKFLIFYIQYSILEF